MDNIGPAFGFRATELRFQAARKNPRAFLAASAPSLGDLLPPVPKTMVAVRAREFALAEALPKDPYLCALITSAELARAFEIEQQSDGRTVVRWL